MVKMIFMMSGATALYVLLTALVWRRWNASDRGLRQKLIVGLIYGLCSVASTHFGIDYGSMLLNVRDIGPLAAGLYFHPLSGVIAGLIGGVERYIAGTYWGVGSYTRIACGLSTCIAGFLTIVLNNKSFQWNRPSPVYAFIIGAVMEVFHMYVVFITHREDITMAYYVVKTCSMPMILFTGLGMAAIAIVLLHQSGAWINPFRSFDKAESPVAQRFQRWLLTVSMIIFAFNISLSWMMQSQVAEHNARDTLKDVAGDIQQTYDRVRAVESGIQRFGESVALADAGAIARSLDARGGVTAADSVYLDAVARVFDLDFLQVVTDAGETAYVHGKDADAISAFLESSTEGRAIWQSENAWMTAEAKCSGGQVRVAINQKSMARIMSLDGLNDALSYFHVGRAGSFDIIDGAGTIYVGGHRGKTLTPRELQTLQSRDKETFFNATMFLEESTCYLVSLEDGLTLLTRLPLTEVYESRNSQLYESLFADILQFAVIYMLITYLIRQIVVKNLNRVNASLGKITGGDLNEVVAVRESSEFALLSADINLTVEALKGYIDAAKKRIEQELSFAHAIQDAALPKDFNFNRDDFELYAMMDPAREVGGDFYDFFFIEPDRLALVIADVSGKGIPAAMFMMRSMTTIRSLAGSGADPAEILRRANATLCEGNDMEMFVTAWIGIIDLKTGIMDCASAGHEYPVRMLSGGGYALYRDRHGLPLAAMDGARYRDYTLELHPGDRLFVYTDGVPEAINARQAQYGAARMLNVLNVARDWTMADTLSAVRRDIAIFAGDEEQFDDITMLGFIYHGKDVGRSDIMKELTVAAVLENIPVLTDFIDRELEALECPMKAQMQLDIAIDELFTNIAMYAYAPGTGDATVRFEFDAQTRTVSVTFIDRGMPFDPLQKADPDVTLSAEEREIGGLGIFLVKKTMDAMRYERIGDENRLTIEKRI